MTLQDGSPPLTPPRSTVYDSDDTPWSTSTSLGYYPGPDVWGAQLSRSGTTGSVARSPIDPYTPIPAPPSAKRQRPFAMRSQSLPDGPSTPEMQIASALPESPDILTHPEPQGRPLQRTSSAPTRASLGRKLPPSLTESLERLIRTTQKKSQPALHSVPEDDTTPKATCVIQVPDALRTPRPTSDTPMGIPKPRHRRTNSASAMDIDGHLVVPLVSGLPRSPSASHVTPVPLQAPFIMRPVNDHRHSASSMESTSSASSYASTVDMSTTSRAPTSACYRGISPRQRFRSITSSGSLTERAPEFISSMADLQLILAQQSPDGLDAYARPSISQLLYARELKLVDDHGVSVSFGDLVAANRTIVVFLRHWYSSFDAQYVKALVKALSPTVLARAGARVVLIGHGKASMIKGYRQHFECPFPVYTDTSRELHRALGLETAAVEKKRGDYLSQNVFQRGRDSLMRAVRMRQLGGAGNRDQLGGEFVFDGSLQLRYSHRMSGRADHASVAELIKAVSALPPTPRGKPFRSSAGSRSCVSINGSRSSASLGTRSNAARSCTSLAAPTTPPPPHGGPPLALSLAPVLEYPIPPVNYASDKKLTDRWEAQREMRLAMKHNMRMPFGGSEIVLSKNVNLFSGGIETIRA